ncbi:MAG TPA: ATP-binding protein [Candidatus Limnocylindria bacterium]|nr:ATP-binding protein [Candidatus Limnocylindria bacterium]
MPRSIRARILLGSVVTILVALAVVAAAVPAIATQHEIDVLGARLSSEAALAADLARESFVRTDADALDLLAKRISADASVRVTFVGTDGGVLGESDEDRRTMENHAGRPEIVPALAGSEGRAVRHSATVGRDLLYVAVPVRAGDRIVGVSRLALPLVAVDALATRLSLSLIAAAVVAAAVAFVAAWVIQRAIARPIELLTERAESPSATFDVRGPQEVERLAAALRRASAAIGAEHAAAEAERDHLAALVDELSDAILIADAEGHVVLANAAARASAGPDVVGRRLPEVVRDHEILEAIAAARGGREATTTIERSDPRRFARAVARPLDGGQLLVVVQDLTALRRLETVRSDFVANVSHELRRPISSLKAMAEALEEGALDEPAAARDFVQRMHQEIDGLAQLVNELLALTRIESGAETLALRPQSPSDLLAECARRMGPLAARADVSLLVEPSDAPRVRADGERVSQVLANLVHNAVKFTPAGGTVRLAAARDDGRVVFSVADSGVGIERADLERVFERFYKADRARSGGGTGLGLAIAKHIVQAHGGTIEARSDGPGRGATFRFTLPLAGA